VRRLDALEAHSLPGTDGAEHPRFSPDNRWILYEDGGGRLNKIPIEGGSPSLVTRLNFWEGHSWGSRGDIVYSGDFEIWHLGATGERPTKIVSIDSAKGDNNFAGPSVLPDGDHVLYTIGQSRYQSTGFKLGVVSLADRKPRTTELIGVSPLGYTDGWLLYGRADGTIAAIKFDPRSGRATGEPVALLDGVSWKPEGGVNATMSSSGSLIYLRGGSNAFLSVLDARGSPLNTNGELRSYWGPTWSPDGKRIAVEVRTTGPGPTNAIWIYDVASGVFSRVTSRVSAERPSWTADGQRIAFIKADDAGGVSSSVWSVPADGSGPEELFFSLPGLAFREVTFSPDGNYAILRENTGKAERPAALWLLSLRGERKAVPVGPTPFTALLPAVSPNSKWIAYESDATGRVETYVREIEARGAVLQISSGGGREPRWLADGRLVYRSDGTFRTATLGGASSALTVVRRDSLFPDNYRPSEDRQNYDISRDGRFVVARDASEQGSIVVVVNWLAEVRAKLQRR
jgi:Tol biopolymer transport system component